MNEVQMFCFQCEQTAKGKNCTTFGVCGKNPRSSNPPRPAMLAPITLIPERH